MFKKIKFSDIEHIEFYVPQKRISITSAYNNHLWNGRKCNVICNGTLFDMNTDAGSTITYGAKQGVQVGYLFSKEGLLIDGNTIKFGELSQALTDGKDFVGSAPLLTKKGKYVYDWGNKNPSSSLTGKHIRTGIGLTSSELVMYTSDDSITLETLNQRFKDVGCTEIINLDGGGSTSMIIDGKYIRNTSRLLANFIMVWTKQQKESSDDEMIVKEKINVNGVMVECDTITKNGVTYVPMRKLAEMLGAKVTYDPQTKIKGIETTTLQKEEVTNVKKLKPLS